MAIDYFFLFSLFIFFSLLYKSSHLLSLLISLEMVSLYLFFSFAVMYFSFFFDFFMLLFYISVTACESALGLVLFVFFNRQYSKDYIISLGLMKY